MLKSDLEGEALREHGYDVILTISFVVVVLGTGVVGVLRKLLSSTRIVMQATASMLEVRQNEADLLFERLDKDSDGVLSLTELKAGLTVSVDTCSTCVHIFVASIT